MTTRRITPEEVVKAYDETGLRAVQKLWFCADCACPAGAIFIWKHASFPFDNVPNCTMEIIRRALEVSNDYLEGFVEAFDGGSSMSNREEYQQGFEDGTKALEAVKDRL